jgi:hypothetical protein
MSTNTTGPACDPAFLDVTRGMQDMVTEAWLDRNDCIDAREVVRHPHAVWVYVGEALTDRLVLMC